MEIVNAINLVFAILFFVFGFHQYLYLFVPFFRKHKPHKETTIHHYAILISARNEANVIGELIESINNQNYPSDKITIFVVADNCTDDTAAVARKKGAIAWERFNQEKIGKGYALDFLLAKIKEAYPDDPFDGYMVFDADNILDVNFVSEMNKTFSDGHEIITSYRNTKNFGDNWITAGYGMMFLREAKYINESRMLLNLSCAVSGTGFLFSRNIKNKLRGWNFKLLTEDVQFTAHNIIKGRKIAMCPTAILYDEQPLTFRQSWIQRMRWAKGFLQVFTHYSWGLLKGIFQKKSVSCYEFFAALVPISLLSMASLLMNSIAVIVGLCCQVNVIQPLTAVGSFFVNSYAIFFVMGIFVLATEWKKIHCPNHKKIRYLFTYPVFMMTYVPIGAVALFRKIEWKPIPHGTSSAKNLSEIYAADEKKKSSETAVSMSKSDLYETENSQTRGNIIDFRDLEKQNKVASREAK